MSKPFPHDTIARLREATDGGADHSHEANSFNSSAESPILLPKTTVTQPDFELLHEAKEKLPDPHGSLGVYWPDYQVNLQYSRQFKAWEIKFNSGASEDRPSNTILKFIKEEAGLHWNRHNKAWGVTHHGTSSEEAYQHVRFAFDTVVEMLTEEKGPPGLPKQIVKVI